MLRVAGCGSRVITEGYRQQGFEDNGPMPRCFLVDGFTAGTWTVSTTRSAATLLVQPFARQNLILVLDEVPE